MQAGERAADLGASLLGLALAHHAPLVGAHMTSCGVVAVRCQTVSDSRKRLTRDHGYWHQTDISRTDNHSARLLRISPAGGVTELDLYRYTGGQPLWWPHTGQVLPDGLGGIVATWSRSEPSQLAQPTVEVWGVTRLDAEGGTEATIAPELPGSHPTGSTDSRR